MRRVVITERSICYVLLLCVASVLQTFVSATDVFPAAGANYRQRGLYISTVDILRRRSAAVDYRRRRVLLPSIPAAGTHWQLTFIAGAQLPSPATTRYRHHPLSPYSRRLLLTSSLAVDTVIALLLSTYYGVRPMRSTLPLAVDAIYSRRGHCATAVDIFRRCTSAVDVHRRRSPAVDYRRRRTPAVDVLASHISNSNADRCLIPVRSCPRRHAPFVYFYCCVCCSRPI